MSTILKALKKAEGARTQETLAGKVISEGAPGEGDRRSVPLRFGFILLLAALAAGVLIHRHLTTARDGEARTAVPPDEKADHEPRPSATPLPPAELPNLNLAGVIWDESRPIAVINGRMVAVGDTIEGADIIGIDLDGVQMRYGRSEFTIKVR